MTNFNAEVDAILLHKSRSKGYDGGKGQLWLLCKDLPHPLGEIIYKVVRYHAKGDPDDLVKIAGWARLIWEERHVNGTGSDDGGDAFEAFTRAANTRLQSRSPHSRAGDLGSDSRGRGRGEGTEVIRAVSRKSKGVKGGTRTGGRSRKPVGK